MWSWKVQLSYSGKPSLLFKFKEGIVKFMNEADGDTASKKEVLQKLADKYSMNITETDTHDQDRVGFKGSARRSLSFI